MRSDNKTTVEHIDKEFEWLPMDFASPDFLNTSTWPGNPVLPIYHTTSIQYQALENRHPNSSQGQMQPSMGEALDTILLTPDLSIDDLRAAFNGDFEGPAAILHQASRFSGSLRETDCSALERWRVCSHDNWGLLSLYAGFDINFNNPEAFKNQATRTVGIAFKH